MKPQVETLIVTNPWGEHPTELRFEIPAGLGTGLSHSTFMYLDNIDFSRINGEIAYKFGDILEKSHTIDAFTLSKTDVAAGKGSATLANLVSNLVPTPIWMIISMYCFKSGFTKRWASYTGHSLRMIAARIHEDNINLPEMSYLEFLRFVARFGYVSRWSLWLSSNSQGMPLLHCIAVQSAVNKALLKIGILR
jgi:hypothetical protein